MRGPRSAAGERLVEAQGVTAGYADVPVLGPLGVELRLVQRVCQSADERGRHVARQLRVGVEREHVADGREA